MSAERVLIELKKDVEDGNTGDPLWSKGMRLYVDPVSAKAYVKDRVAVVVDEDEPVTDEPVADDPADDSAAEPDADVVGDVSGFGDDPARS